jgi:hypothetical protein
MTTMLGALKEKLQRWDAAAFAFRAGIRPMIFYLFEGFRSSRKRLRNCGVGSRHASLFPNHR